MQNSYTTEGQLSWWLALYESIREGDSNPFPSKLKSIFFLTQYPPKPAQPAQLESPQAGPRALDLPRARPGQPFDVARPGPLETLKTYMI